MKKLLAVITALVLALSMCLAVSAEESSDGISVYVTISDGTGMPVVAHQLFDVTDLDGDGALTINDALIAAHDAEFDGGSAAGYGSSETEYGLSMTRLWGVENGGSYGYYVNNTSAMSLQDPIADGDSVVAFAYSDLTAWSDMYCWFEPVSVELKKGESVELTLNGSSYDADWNPVTAPVAGAEITVDGESTGLTTDENGKVTYTADKAGTLTISAVSGTQVLVPPVCIAEVASSGASPIVWVLIAAAVIAVIVVAVILAFKKKK